MSNILLISLFFSLLSISCTDTYSFKCADELKLDTCYLTSSTTVGSDTNYIHYVSPCSKGKYCDVSISGLGTCIKREKNELLSQGEKCKLKYECKSGICDNGKCGYLEDGTECKDGNSCKSTSVCVSNGTKFVCTALVGKGGKCEQDLECKLGLLCNEGNNQCTEMFSLNDGEVATNDYLCKGGVRIDGKCATTSISDATCNSDGKCKVNFNNIEYEVYCEEDFNLQKLFCPLQSDSEALKNYIKKFNDKKDDIDEDEEFDVVDKLARYTVNDNKELLQAYTAVIYDNIFKDADDCVKNYWYRQADANINKFPAILLILLSIIF